MTKRAIFITLLLGLALGLPFVGVAASAVSDPCEGTANEIVCENAKPGNPSSQWDIDGMGDPSIQGFATEFSVDQGGTARFKVKTDASDYRLDIYRVGYYSGMGARKVATVQPSAALPQTQPACLTQPATGLVDCGNWAESASWSVPSDAVSGVYFAHLVRTDTGGDSHMMFVVRDDDGQSEVLFQTSDTTWQAYNRYGGNSLYVGSPAGRAYKVSYNRPFTTRDFASPSFLWEDEYPMVRWLERNGYDVSYSSGIDSDRRGEELLEHDAFLSVGHDEYWSAGQRSNVEAARAAGVHLAFFSSNEIFWKTRWENSIDGSGTPYRTLVSYKETKAGAKIDPDPAWTGTWRDARFSPPADGGRPENSLTGQLFTVDAYRNDPMRVPAEFGSMRLWRNTSVASLQPGQVATFANGIIGHEFDEDVDNGQRPPGLMQLSSTTLDVDKHLVDEGNTYVPGTATHNLTLYRHSSGALVFGAGTSQWSWGLDGEHDYFFGADEIDPDQRLQQATLNLFADMNVQPATRQSDLVPASASTDASAPTSTITSPASGHEVRGGTTVTVTGTASETGGGVVAAVEVTVDGGATWHRATGRASWSYTWTVGGFGSVQVKSRAVDDSGNLETPGPGITVVVSCPCSIWNPQTTPSAVSSSDTKAVNLGVKFRADVNGFVNGVRFYKGPGNLGTHVGSLWSTTGTLLARATFTGETASGWQEVSFDDPVPVTAGTTYVASYFAPVGRYALDAFYFSFFDTVNPPLRALADGAAGGNGVFVYAASSAFPTQTNKASNYWVDVAFDTTLRTDTTPPTVTSTSPAADATAVDNRTDVTARFSEAMDAGSISAASFELQTALGDPVPATVAYDPAARTATLTPTVPLDYAAWFTAALEGGTAGVKDRAGNPLASPPTWSFTTLAPPTCPCTLWTDAARPKVETSTDTKAVNLGVKFRADNAGYVTGLRFFKGAGNGGTHVGSLWTATGTLLARATFTEETASGWQTMNFDTPVPLTADTTYVASYFAPVGRYALDTGYFASAYANPPLRALRDGVSGGNGVFLYATSSAFPTQTNQSSNYWVDVNFNSELPSDTTPPRVVATAPAAGSTDGDVRGNVTASFSEGVDPATVGAGTFALRDSGGTLVPAAVSYDATTRKATLTPAASLAYEATYTATVKGGADGVKDLAGLPLAEDHVWSFTTAAPRACPCSLWTDAARPAVATSTDTRATELGVKFRTDAPGLISAIRFYKGGTTNGGTHVGNLWTAGGTLLGRVTFVGETASGWQTAYFSSPVAIEADTTYVASYFAPQGRYSLDLDYFTTGFANPPVRALGSGVEGGNGVFVYSASTGFPTQTNRASNYWVDVVFERAQLLTAAPGTAVQPGGSTPVATGDVNSLALDFGNVASQQTFADVFRVTNVSAEPHTYTVSVGNVHQLEAATFASSGTNTTTLAAGASTSVSVRTSEAAAGRVTGWLEIDVAGLERPYRSFAATVETAPGDVGALSARPRPAGRIELTWPASPTTEGLLGYNVYRSTGAGFARVNDSPVTSTSFTDAGTTDGQSHTYLVRALGTGTNVPESGDSPQAAAQADATAPTAGSAQPAQGTSDLSADAVAGAAFSEAMDPASLATGFTLTDEHGGAVAATVSFDAEAGRATLTPAAPLPLWRNYTATLRGGAGGVTDLAGNPLAGDYMWSFSTLSPFVVEAGPAVQAGTSTPIATVGPGGINLDFGVVPSARTFTGVLRVRNASAWPQNADLEIVALNQVSSAWFAVSNVSSATLAPGESTLVNVATSPLIAGHGIGAIRLQPIGGSRHVDYPTAIAVAPERPATLSASAQAAGRIAVSWAASATTTNLAGYDVYRAAGGAYTKLNTAPLVGTTFTDTGTINGTLYSYRVQAISTGSPPLQSLDSPTASARADATPPAVPSSVALANGGGTGNAYINLANRASISVAVGVPASAISSDTLTVTLSIGAQSVSKTSPSRNGAGTVTVTGINTTSLADGAVTLAVTARDLAGNVSAARTRTVTKDTVAPGVPTATYVDRLSPLGDRITGTAAASSTVRATRTAPSSAGPYSTTASTSGAYTVTVAAARNVTVTYNVNARDTAGNVSGNRTITFATTR